MGTILYRRPPRPPAPPLPRGELALESPPEITEPGPRSARQLLMLLPMVVGGAAMAIMYANRSGGPLTYVVGGLFGVSMLSMAFMSFGAGQGSRRAEVDGRRREYLRYLTQSRRQVHRAADQQRTAQLWRHPPPGILWSVPTSGRLWERRSPDADFGEVRVAVGPQRLAVSLVAPQTRPLEDLEPLTALALRRFVQAHSTVPDLPVALQLRAFSRVALRGEREPIVGLSRALIVQFAAFHSPDDARVAVVTDPARAAEWDWVKWLPHSQDDRRTDAAGSVRLVFDSVAALEKALGDEVIGRPRHSPDAPPRPGDAHLLVILDGVGTAGSAQLDGIGPLGCTVLDLAGTVPPDAGRWLLVLDVTADRLAVDRGDRLAPLGRPDRLSPAAAAGIARALAPYRLSHHVAEAETATTRVMQLPDLLGVPDAAAIDPAQTWRPRSERERLRIPLGVAPNGSTVELDLKESALNGMGPHGLVIGATGSGKSELLRTLVASLAVTHSSEELNFVLIDFKGGATFASMDALPHTSAVITNLAEELPLVDRMQDAISGELVRRQELLRAAGNYVSRHEYELARKAGEPLSPLPSLLIICDEFSELLANKPDFIELFVMIGRLGRSLGVHLLLASQQLEEGRLRGLDNHLSYRIGLRTFSAMESRIVLGVPDAYELPNAPGHGFVKVGTQVMQRFRAAYVSGPYRPPVAGAGPAAGRSARAVVPYLARAIPEPAVEAPAARPEPALSPEGGRNATLLDVIIDRLRGHGPPAHQVWLPPLDQAPPLDALLGPLVTDDRRGLIAATWRTESRLTVPVGLEDRPFDQRRDPLVVDLSGSAGNVVIVGGPRSGKSTLLRTLIAALALTHSPREVQFMCIDLGGGSLRALEDLPHVSGVALRRDREAVRRTVAEVSTLLEEREAAFAARGIGSIDEYRDRRDTGDLDDPFGDVFLIIDGYGLLREEYDDLDATINAMVGRCLGFGIHVVLTASRWGDIRFNVREFYGSKLELRLGDPGDSEIDRRAAANVPAAAPGRGLSRNAMHFLAAVPRIDGRPGPEGLPDGTAGLVGAVRSGWAHDPAPRVRLLPRLLPAPKLWHIADRPSPAIPIGVDESHLAPVYLDPSIDSHLVVFGDAECGKTNLLRLIARTLTQRSTPEQVKFAVVDYRRTLLGMVPDEYRLEYATSAQRTSGMAAGLYKALSDRLPGPDVTTEQLRRRSWWTGPEIYILIDDYDLVAGTGGATTNPLLKLVELLPQARDVGLHVFVARRAGGAARAQFDPVLGKLRELDAPGLVMSGNKHEGALVGTVKPSPQPPGRGFLVRRRDGTNLVQTAFLDDPASGP